MKSIKIILQKCFSSYIIPFTFVIFWSVGSIFNKLGLAYSTPFAFLFFRLMLASLFLILLAFIIKAPWPTTWKMLQRIVLAGLVLQFGYLTLFYYALYHEVSPAIITLILGLQPIFTVAILEFILKKNITRNQWIGSFLGLSGVFLIVSKDLSSGHMTISGLGFSIASLIAITIGTLMQKKNSDMNIVTGTAIQLAISIIPTAIFNFFLGSFFIPLNPLFLFSLVWVALVVSVGAICIFYTLLKKDLL